MIKVCEICGDEYEASRSTQKYCKVCGKNSSKARMKYQLAVHNNKIHAGEFDRPKEVNCKYCGKVFHTLYGRTFCSEQCEKSYIVENNTCTFCHCKLIDKGIRISHYGKVFCSDECRAAFREKYKPKPAEADQIVPEGQELLRCLICNKLFQRPISKDPYVCSPTCSNIYQTRFAHKKSSPITTKLKNDKKSRQVHLCTECKTSYKDCKWMQSKYTAYPVGAVVKDGNVLSCPSYTSRS